MSSELEITPGITDFYSPSTQTTFIVDENGTVDGIEDLSIWLHGSGHETLRADPRFTMTVAQPGTFSISVNEVSPFSGAIKIRVDGDTVFRNSYRGGEKDFLISVPLDPGKHVVEVLNTGNDFFKLNWFKFEGLALPSVAALAQVGSNHAFIWIYDRGNQYHFHDNGLISDVTLKLPGLPNGNYFIEYWKTRHSGGLVDTVKAQSIDNKLEIPLPDFNKDIAVKVHMDNR